MNVLRADRALVLAAGLTAVLLHGKVVFAQANDGFPVYWDRSFPNELQDPAEAPSQLAPYPPAQSRPAPVVQFGAAPPQQSPAQANRPVLLAPSVGIQQVPNGQTPPQAAPRGPVQLWPQTPVQPQQRDASPVALSAPPAPPVQQQVQPRAPLDLRGPGMQNPEMEGRSVQPRAARDAVGVLDTRTNGSLGPDIWKGTSRDVALRALQQMPHGANSPVMRSLATRVLLTRARPPEGLDAVTWGKARFAKLFEMGELLEAVELAHAASDQFEDEELARRTVEALLLAGVEEGACLDVRAKAPRFNTTFWQQALVYCRMDAGEQKAAQALAAALRDRGEDDPVFFALFAAMNGAKAELPPLRELSPLHLAMAQSAKIRLPADAVSVQDPTRLAAIARQPNLPAEIRLRAAERAAQAGTLSPEALAAVYRAVPPAGEGSANAALYRSIRGEKTIGKRAELLARWFQQARWPADPATRLRLDMVRPLDPTPSTVPLAPFAAKALLAAGDAEMAWPWLELAGQSGNPEVQKQVALLWPLGLMYDNAMLDRGMMNRWLETVNQMPNGPARVARVMGVLNALGYDLPGGATNAAAGVGGQSGVFQQLDAAAAGRREGETIVMSLIALGRDGLAGADPFVVSTVIRSLRRAGLELEARAAAREANAAAIT